jgi:peptide deformylase
MAIRELRYDGDELLRKKSREVDKIDDRILTLLDDMAETMYAKNGVGLAAPQVGILKRVVVIDVGEGLMELINPVIIESSGTQECQEGCLSVPGLYGEVERPARIKVKALNRKGEEFTYTATDLLACCTCHEIDHLDGIIFTDKAANITRVD